MVQYSPPICWACKHFRGRETKSCEAFPEGIPNSIYFEAGLHDRPVEGDHGLRFDARLDDSSQTYLRLHGYS